MVSSKKQSQWKAVSHSGKRTCASSGAICWLHPVHAPGAVCARIAAISVPDLEGFFYFLNKTRKIKHEHRHEL
jgi:hypothetical protein